MPTKFRIVPKRDFGGRPFLINGEYVRTGFVVTDGFCNVMPGATWFRTIPHALHGIWALNTAQKQGLDFWNLVRLPIARGAA